MNEPINVPAVVNQEPQQQVQRYQPDGPRELVPSTPAQVSKGLDAIRAIMRECMVDGQDYGKVPGCGDKVGLFQPGAQKLSMTFQLNPEVYREEVTDYPNFHRGYRLVVRVANGPKYADGVGECSTMESKYRFRTAGKVCPECGKEAVLKSKNAGDGWFCWFKKGGCGATFAPNTPGSNKIESQAGGKVEHDNPADFWNIVRKMAFKRAFVHAIINATNTSELWSQDLEDLAANGVVKGEEAQNVLRRTIQEPPQPTAAPPTPPAPQSRPEDEKEPIKFPDAEVTTEAVLTRWLRYDGKSSKSGKAYVRHTLKLVDADDRAFEVTTFDGDEQWLEGARANGDRLQVTHKTGYKGKGRELVSITQADDLPT
jgi:hypothetical protein